VLFIDSLDQLSNTYEERSRLTFLLNIKLLDDSRIIVSCLPDDSNYKYLCEKRLSDSSVPRLDVGYLDTSDAQEMDAIVTQVLGKAYGRRITKDQMTHAMTAIRAEPSALYVTLAARVMSSWGSYDDSTTTPTADAATVTFASAAAAAATSTAATIVTAGLSLKLETSVRSIIIDQIFPS
jgi:hypothetical protein